MAVFGSLESLQEYIRLHELHVRDMTLLAGCDRPTLLVLYQDHREQKHVKV